LYRGDIPEIIGRHHSSSPGYQAGSDSNDMGADVSLVGVDAGEEDPPSTPSIRNGGVRSGGFNP